LKKSLINVLILLLSVLFVSCSTQNKLARTYKNKNESFLFSKLGQPIRIEKQTGGKKIDVYEKRTILSSTPISTGQFRYDRFDSPKSTKIETYYFEINSTGIIEDVRYECIYER
jgi:hypothetical protein